MSTSKSDNGQQGASPVRLNKFLADAGLSSRRGAEEMVRQGRVSINGQTVRELGVKVIPGQDQVAVDGKPVLAAGPGEERHIYLLCHKPVQVLSTAHDPQGRQTVLDLLPPRWRSCRLYPVGRLDYFSEGLILLTNDGELTLRLTHPRYHLPKTYRVRLRQEASEGELALMRKGMTLAEGERLAPVEVWPLRGDQRVLEMVLRQGVNRQIRRMCRDLGLTILSLCRIAQGPLRLGSLPAGQVRELDIDELRALKQAVGLPG